MGKLRIKTPIREPLPTPEAEAARFVEVGSKVRFRGWHP